MAFFADFLMIVFCIVYLKLNKRLFRWRLMVTKKYPRAYSESKSFKADLRGMWEFMVSVSLSCALFSVWMLALLWPLRFGHESAQLVAILGIIHWAYTFVFIGAYPESHQFVSWIRRKVFKTAEG